VEETESVIESMLPTKCILGNDHYGLYFGMVVAYNSKSKVAVVEDCRGIIEYHTKTGGITTLATEGLCGPKAGDSLIGAPVPQAVLTHIVNIFVCTERAIDSIEGVPVRIPKK